MAEQYLNEGNSLILDEEYEKAIDSYTKGLEIEPQNPQLLLRRSTAHFELGKHLQALSDVNKGLEASPNDLGLIMRKGRACFALEEFETAVEMFQKGKSVDTPDSKKWDTWIRKCEAELEDEEEDEEEPAAAPAAKPVVAPVTHKPQANPVTKPKVRREWYQTDQAVVITLFARGVKEDEFHLDFADSRTVHIVIDGEVYDSTITLQSAVKVDAVKHRIFGSKVEITLPKAQQVRWNALEGDATGPTAAVAAPLPAGSKPAAQYPSSSKKAVNWDKLVKDEEEEPEGEEALNKVFKDIFARGTTEQKQAMMKSFTESAGTVLSTNWDEVGSGKVEISPPDGLEVKDYNEWKK